MNNAKRHLIFKGDSQYFINNYQQRNVLKSSKIFTITRVHNDVEIKRVSEPNIPEHCKLYLLFNLQYHNVKCTEEHTAENQHRLSSDRRWDERCYRCRSNYYANILERRKVKLEEEVMMVIVLNSWVSFKMVGKAGTNCYWEVKVRGQNGGKNTTGDIALQVGKKLTSLSSAVHRSQSELDTTHCRCICNIIHLLGRVIIK